MPRRDDIKTILIIGSGPIVIGQACEFDYSGTQACKTLRDEGYRIVLLNSNPATIMTDSCLADRTYIEPITPEFLEKIFELEKLRGNPVDALLPTLGGQTALNCAMEAVELGVIEKFGVELIGASKEAIAKAEDRSLFRTTMKNIGVDLPKSGIAHSYQEALDVLNDVKLPCCIRPAYTMGGEGGGFCRTIDEFERIARSGLALSRINEVLIEESLYGWKEFELEVVRDRNDNFVVICSIENFDPMGVHTGDSITVAPAQTLTDREFQQMRNTAKAAVKEIGVDTGGCNVQFAINPKTGRQVVIEINPRVSRSSALASKATGYPIAKVAARLAVGYTMDELINDITGTTAASFEPAIDYCVVKMPRWAFEKFPEAKDELTTHMKSVGEAMAIGRTFKESWQKCLRSLEVQLSGFGLDRNDKWINSIRNVNHCSKAEESVEHWPLDEGHIKERLTTPNSKRPIYIRYALKAGFTVKQINELTSIDNWFLEQLNQLVTFEDKLLSFFSGSDGESKEAEDLLRQARRYGYTEEQISALLGHQLPSDLYAGIAKLGDCFKSVDTCAAEFEAQTPYYYSTTEDQVFKVDPDGGFSAKVDDELEVNEGPHVVIIGGGPNRIGQGIEFDYCCVQACEAVREMGFKTVMINSNPETVSTDNDVSDVLFFEPVRSEDVLRVVKAIDRKTKLSGVVIQFGGQTPLNLASTIQAAGFKILGTPPSSIDLAEDRGAFQEILHELKISQPPSAMASTASEAREIANQLGYPILIRPSYVLGGRAMQRCNNPGDLERSLIPAFKATDFENESVPANEVLIDKFLFNATEVDVDAVADFRQPNDIDGECVVCGVMEHIEEAGIHSGDSVCALPPHSLSTVIKDEIETQTRAIARKIGVCGLLNIQFAVANAEVFVLEVNPRASRTVPFVSKATGVPWAKVAMAVMLGRKLRDVLWELGVGRTPRPLMQAIKAPVFPYTKFPGMDMLLGPEMRSTGEAMGIDSSFGIAFAKAAIATGLSLPLSGNALVSVNDLDKAAVIPIAQGLVKQGFKLFSTKGTHLALKHAGIESVVVSKQSGAPEGFLLDLINHDVLDLLVNTPINHGSTEEEGRWRAAALAKRLPLITTIAGARAAVQAISAMKTRNGREVLGVKALQDYESGVI